MTLSGPALPRSAMHQLNEEPIDDLLLALEAQKQSAELNVESPMGRGTLAVRAGVVVDAQFGELHGLDAVDQILALKVGHYSISDRPIGSGAFRASPGKLLIERAKNASALELLRSRPAPSVTTALERTAERLPSDLNAAELRALACVNGKKSALAIVCEGGDSADKSLRAIRTLVARGLVREITSTSTIALGTRRAIAEGKATLSGTPVPEKPGSSFPPSGGSPFPPSGGSDRPGRASSSNPPSMGQMPVPARFGPQKPRGTGYSSVPPPALAEEKVSLPSSLRNAEVVPRLDEEREEAGRPDETHVRHAIQSARVLPDDGLHQARTYDEAPAPRGSSERPPSTARSNEVPNEGSDASLSSPVAQLDLEPSRPPVVEELVFSPGDEFRAQAPPHDPDFDEDSDDPLDRPYRTTDFDDIVVQAAGGQLSDSEMPVPSTRLGDAALAQLDELNEAIGSSRQPSRAFKYLAADQESTAERNPPSPGSVPHPDALPGGEDAVNSSTGLPTVGRYEVLARLKSGGMGSVYMCRLSGSAGFRRLFAMKVLHSHLASDGDALEAFFHEARVLGGMHHPNIVGIVDVGTPSEPYIVLDYVEGGNLVELFRATQKGRNPALIVSVILDALSGLSAAHDARDEGDEPLRLVHDDVTPHNLLVGVDGTCRVTDFGIARTRDNLSEGVMRGKPGYLAPERLKKQKCDQRSDLFSLGVVLYAGLTGIEPFAGETPDDTMRNVLSLPIEPPSEVGFRSPPCLDWVCMKALARDPEERFQTADEMAAQLRRIAAREGLLAPSTEIAEWVRTALAPTLAARRAASQRGTQTETRLRNSVTPPPAEVTSAPPESPSAAEITGPLSAPPSSRSFEEQTEIIEAGGSRSEKLRAVVVYLALAAAMIALVWVVLRPDAVAKFFHRTPGAQQGRLVPTDGVASPTHNGEEGSTSTPEQGKDAKDEADETAIKLPEIAPHSRQP